MVLKYEVDEHVATVTLNRPEAMNALTRELYGELEQAMRNAHRDPEVRAVIITGEGRAFCSGDDVKQIMLGEQRDASTARLRDVRTAIPDLELGVLFGSSVKGRRRAASDVDVAVRCTGTTD
ncbi:MAG: enoyl-CoA hydratase-related protein, partial [Dehalococcoidia bacterium]